MKFSAERSSFNRFVFLSVVVLSVFSFIGSLHAEIACSKRMLAAISANRPRTSLIGNVLITDKGDLALTDKKVLFFSNNEASLKMLKITAEIPQERRPVIISLVDGKKETENLLEKAELNGTEYRRCIGEAPVEKTKAPFIVMCRSDGTVLILKGKELEETLNEMKYPLMLSYAELPYSNNNSDANALKALMFLDGEVVGQREEFSFYRSIGVPSAERGYLPARSIMRTSEGPKWVEDVGGGICKAATLLHLAVEQVQGLKVTELHHHSLPVPYAPTGKDVAVARSSGKDYKFVNMLDRPVKIKACWKGGMLRLEIWGMRKDRF